MALGEKERSLVIFTCEVSCAVYNSVGVGVHYGWHLFDLDDQCNDAGNTPHASVQTPLGKTYTAHFC
jgi:hypothetical protein